MTTQPPAASNRPTYDVKDPEISRLLDEIVTMLEPYPDLGFLREVMVTGVRLAEDGASRLDVKILRASVKEMRYAFKVFASYQDVPKVSIFGSARSQPDSEEFELARALGRELARRGCMVITGAGDGIMGAGHLGAGREMSFGLNITLPFEQAANQTIDGDSKLINFRYFFTRKLFFVMESSAVVLMPGGFGTMDESFEELTLMQTGKADIVPVIALDRPGGAYWANWRRFIKENLSEGGYISKNDLSLFRVADTVEEVCEEIELFYRRYHSSRYVDRRRRLILRLKEELTDEHVARLNVDFSDIIVEGRIEKVAAPAEEAGEPESILRLPRLAFAFDQHHFSRLRQLIDAINQ